MDSNVGTLKSRAIVSFDGYCPFKCKHCYTFGLKETAVNKTVDDIIAQLKNQTFDVVYISHNKENFLIPMDGFRLCEKTFSEFNCDVFAITRNVFDNSILEKLSILSNQMRQNNKLFYLAVSIPALSSAHITEQIDLMPTPEERLDFLKRAKQHNILTLLTIRPLFPSSIIPISEPIEIIEQSAEFIDCVLSSGLAVNSTILGQLNISANEFSYISNKLSDYLVGAIEGDVKYVNVEDELKIIAQKCNAMNIPFFEHSMFALNYLRKRELHL